MMAGVKCDWVCKNGVCGHIKFDYFSKFLWLIIFLYDPLITVADPEICKGGFHIWGDTHMLGGSGACPPGNFW